ncbi:MAG: hypothetical protein KDA55_17540, partial [Planctomycetales bacterium]|nr:hypothetical protein [Planctomycetales bacterium]
MTSNRPDCLGHIGIAREVAVLWDQPLTIADPQPKAAGPAVDGLLKVSIDCPELCRRYSARVIRGVRVAPSPAWLVERLATIGIAAINNVVDITNYVLMENGQPLHAFDYDILVRRAQQAGDRTPTIIVRRAADGEKFMTLDDVTRTLDSSMLMIADTLGSVAIAGVMGGQESEISDNTRNILLESATFEGINN